METGKIKLYNVEKGFGFITSASGEDIFFHYSKIDPALYLLCTAQKSVGEPVHYKVESSKKKTDRKEASDVRLDSALRFIGYVAKFSELGYGFINAIEGDKSYFIHYSGIRAKNNKFVNIEEGDPVLFSVRPGQKGEEAHDVVLLDTRNHLEKYADFENFKQSLDDLENTAENEDWDYLKKKTNGNPVLYSYINHTFSRCLTQGKVIQAKSKDGGVYTCFNTGLVNKFQEEIYGFFQQLDNIQPKDALGIPNANFGFLEFGTDQSRHRKYFSVMPEIATYFDEAEIVNLIFDPSINIIADRDHILKRKNRFPDSVMILSDEQFFELLQKAIELAKKRAKRNYKTAIPHFYDNTIQFLLPLCMTSKSEADLALVVYKDEQVYRAETVLTLDQAYNNARLLAKPDREWLNP